MLFHFGYFHAGWIGVQIFFVLSGYLITTILIKNRNTNFGAYLGRFYWRRTLRIFPPYYFFLLATLVIYVGKGVPSAFPNDWPWLFGYAANFARLREGDLPTHVHTWSLALEEQFYLIWPLAVFFLSSRRLRILIVIILTCVPLFRLAIFQGLSALHYSTDFAGRTVYGLPFTQFDAFAAGAAIAVFQLEQLHNATRWFFILVGIAAISGLTILIVDHIFNRSAFIGSLGFALY
jgi:peptidoglycan/LPS O-acetylase OafA/YrhL